MTLWLGGWAAVPAGGKQKAGMGNQRATVPRGKQSTTWKRLRSSFVADAGYLRRAVMIWSASAQDLMQLNFFFFIGKHLHPRIVTRRDKCQVSARSIGSHPQYSIICQPMDYKMSEQHLRQRQTLRMHRPNQRPWFGWAAHKMKKRDRKLKILRRQNCWLYKSSGNFNFLIQLVRLSSAGVAIKCLVWHRFLHPSWCRPAVYLGLAVRIQQLCVSIVSRSARLLHEQQKKSLFCNCKGTRG